MVFRSRRSGSGGTPTQSANTSRSAASWSVLGEGRVDPVEHGVRGQHEQRRRSRRDLVPDLVDEAVVDPDVVERSRKCAGRRSDGCPQQRHEEDHPEQQAPEGAAEGAGSRCAGELTRPRLLLALLPGDGRGVVEDDEVLARELLQRLRCLVRSIGTVEPPDSECRHLVRLDASTGRRPHPNPVRRLHPSSAYVLVLQQGTDGVAMHMTRMLIRVDGELTDELVNAFPHLTSKTHRAQTTLVGDMTDQEELQGVLNLLNTLGIDVVDIVTIPED